MQDPDLSGCRVLLVEDEYIVAKSLTRLLSLFGAEVVGPAATPETALALLKASDELHFAVLDVNLRGTMTFEIADALTERGVPFAFTTGYGLPVIPERYRNAAVLQKPYDVDDICKALVPLRS
jgi:CheY-like chemotaxis protein